MTEISSDRSKLIERCDERVIEHVIIPNENVKKRQLVNNDKGSKKQKTLIKNIKIATEKQIGKMKKRDVDEIQASGSGDSPLEITKESQTPKKGWKKITEAVAVAVQQSRNANHSKKI